MTTPVPGSSDRWNRLLVRIPAGSVGALAPVLVGLPVCLIVWVVTLSAVWFGASLLVLCGLTLVWESLVLVAQNRARGRPSPEDVVEHSWLRARAIVWAVTVTAIAGLLLVAARLNYSIASTLIPGAYFAITEIVVLGLTIGILAILTRYSAITAYVESSRLSRDLDSVIERVNESIGDLKSSIDTLSREVAGLRSAQQPRPRIQASVVYLAPGKKIHTLNWRLACSEATATSVVLVVTVDGIARSPIQLGSLAQGEVKEAGIGSADSLADSGEISLNVSYSGPGNQAYTEVMGFGYTKVKGFWGGIKSVLITRT
jgi:hypothetical protein